MDGDDVELVWTSAEILAHVSLVTEGTGHRGARSGGVPQAGATLGRPLVYPVLADELPVPLRRRAEDGLTKFVGVLCTVELDPIPRGRAYTAVCLTVTLPFDGHRAVSLHADNDVMELMDGIAETRTWPVPPALRELTSRRPARLARLGGPVPVVDPADEHKQRSADFRPCGLFSNEFSWSFDATGGGRLAERTFVTHAVVEVPTDAVALTGRLNCHVTVQRSMGPYVRNDPAVMGEASTFDEPLSGFRTPPVDTGRAVRLFVSVDLERYSRYDIGGGGRAQQRLAYVLERARAATATAVEDHQVGGDSVLFVFPPGIDEGAVLRGFYSALADALADVNLDLNQDAVLRLRVGVDRGQTERAATGWSGQAPIRATRLRDCRATRDAFAAAPSAHLALTVSDTIYHDVVDERGRTPAADAFDRIEIVDRRRTSPLLRGCTSPPDAFAPTLHPGEQRPSHQRTKVHRLTLCDVVCQLTRRHRRRVSVLDDAPAPGRSRQRCRRPAGVARRGCARGSTPWR